MAQPTSHQDEGDSNDESSLFRSPEASENDTDYGLEFSTSRLISQNANNRRSSTLRSESSHTNRNEEHQEDQDNRPSTSRSRQTRQNSGRGEAAGASSRRKQRNPVSRANRMDREIRRLRACTVPLIPRLPFARLVRELIMKYTNSQVRITESALGVLQESSELYLTHRLEDSYMLTRHRGRVTLELRDMVLMAYIMDITHNRS
ncbi:histone H3-like centromeric protein cid [Drosophila serrata]|uniref:histone H3-like centromeric protein cid n=1 Tax=Drosophila serrata TaxID=7274 RepID=UPI000A1D176C|nr:histone H3-like centromeric protein cid [Drosophila serrata]